MQDVWRISLRNLEKIDGGLHKGQHGLRTGLSCETQMSATLHEILSSVYKKHRVHAAVPDLSKAFDSSHTLLINKLASIIDVYSYVLRWIHDFVIDHKSLSSVVPNQVCYQ